MLSPIHVIAGGLALVLGAVALLAKKGGLPMRMLPILLVFGAMFYWLWRIRGRRTFRVLVRNDSMPH